jgi:hypothetical protein
VPIWVTTNISTRGRLPGQALRRVGAGVHPGRARRMDRQKRMIRGLAMGAIK